MKKFLLAATAAATAFAVAPAANAATFIVSGGTYTPVPTVQPGANDFHTELAALGFSHELISANVQVSGEAWIYFEVLGSESGYNDTFTYGTTSFSENTGFTPWTSISLAPVYTNGIGNFLGQFTSSEGTAAGQGDIGFAVFVPTGGGNFSSNTIYFGYDDIPGGDDNHDDLIIKATIVAVPEPATWALMIAGVAAVGVSMRRRSKNVRVAFS